MPRKRSQVPDVEPERVNAAALTRLPALMKRWLPDGELRGDNWVARNPRRDDQRAGSFKVDLRTGKWVDYASQDRGPDVVSLAAFIAGISADKAAQELASMLGLM